jgi:uncharacterized protein YbjT (DUF2867 family)
MMSGADVTLVAGATGKTGSRVAAALLERGHRVRALVRDERKAAALSERGADLAVVDLDRPETLDESLLNGVTGVYFVTWNGPSALAQSRALLATIQSSGEQPLVVRLSAYGTPQSRIVSELASCEAELKASGLPWTILKPTFFMQNLLMTSESVQQQGAVYFDWGAGRAGMIDLRDVVDCAVAVLGGDAGAVAGESFVLTGPDTIGFAEVAATLSRVAGREVEYVPVPHEAASEAMVAMGMPAWIASGYAELSAGFEQGYADLTTDDVRKLSGHRPRSLEQFALDHAQFFAGVVPALA